jgi:hypothetical protein
MPRPTALRVTRHRQQPDSWITRHFEIRHIEYMGDFDAQFVPWTPSWGATLMEMASALIHSYSGTSESLLRSIRNVMRPICAVTDHQGVHHTKDGTTVPAGCRGNPVDLTRPLRPVYYGGDLVNIHIPMIEEERFKPKTKQLSNRAVSTLEWNWSWMAPPPYKQKYIQDCFEPSGASFPTNWIMYALWLPGI